MRVARNGLISRVAVLCIAVALHVVVIAGFLFALRVGLPVLWHPAAHPSETVTPIIASIVSPETHPSFAAAASVPPLDAARLSSLPAGAIDIPTPSVAWPSEDDETYARAQPAPSAGRTGLYCEVHIHQSPAGRVQAIDFGECTGDIVWQHTLLQTIERAAQLVAPAPDAQFPPVRTFTVNTNKLSPLVLSQQLSSTESFVNQTGSKGDDVSSNPR